MDGRRREGDGRGKGKARREKHALFLCGVWGLF